MDITQFPPVAAVLDAAHTLLVGLAGVLDPLVGGAGAALAIVLVTLVVRAVLVPLGARQVRAEVQRRRLAPKLRELQRRHAKRPEVLQRTTLELYRDEGASPFAGVLPALAQAPVLSVLYGVMIMPSIGGHENRLLDATLFGAPIGDALPVLVGSPDAWPTVLVPLALLAAMAVVAWLIRRQTLVLAASSGEPVTRTTRVLASLSFLSVGFAAVVPLAAVVYLTVSTAWTFAERTVLRHRAGILAPVSWRPLSRARGGSKPRAAD